MATILGLDAFDLLKKYHIPCIYSEDIHSLKQLKVWKLPLVMKAISTKHMHKTDSNALSFIHDKKDIEREFYRLRKLGEVIVQTKADGTEVIIGAKSDDTFGKIIMFGLGGTFVETLEDVSFRAAPLNKEDAREMIKEIKGYKILKGARGKKPVNFEILEKTLLKVSNLMTNELIYELDINPFVINSHHGYAVDAKIII